MSSNTIYTLAQAEHFKPTWLYIKQHNTTGLKYFGKTVKNPYKYRGSGTYWKSHLKKYGYDISTIWCKLYTNIDEIVKYAVQFSEENKIVESNDWANLIIENGIDGGCSPSTETRKKISISLIGIGKGIPKPPFSNIHKNNISLALSGKTRNPCTAETKSKIGLSNRMSVNDFIDKSNTIHNKRYSYDKVTYVNAHTHVIINCPMHGDWTTTPNDHLSGCGCPICANIHRGLIKSQKAFLIFIEKASVKFNNKFVYTFDNYNGARDNMIILCPIHGEFKQIPRVHLHSKYGCKQCSHNR